MIRHWRKLLDGQSHEQVLQQYGVHGCLLAGAVLVGKLSRYSYFSRWGRGIALARHGQARPPQLILQMEWASVGR